MDTDGYPHRKTAHVLLFDDSGRVLLTRGHDGDQPERFRWSTIDGDIEEEEDPRGATMREAFEETGIGLSPDDLIGPVLYRTAEFDFLVVTARQDEWLFIVQTPLTALGRDRWTKLERFVTDTQAWWGTNETAAQIGGKIYLTQILEYARVWCDG